MNHTELIVRLRVVVQKLRRTPMPIADVAPMVNEAADAIESLQAENAQLRDQNTELDKKLGELEVDLIKHRELLVRQLLKFDEMNAQIYAYQQASDKMAEEHKIERDALKLDAERYRWLIDNCSCSYAMQPDSPAEHGIEYQWQQGTYEERNHGISTTIDAAIEAMKGAA